MTASACGNVEYVECKMVNLLKMLNYTFGASIKILKRKNIAYREGKRLDPHSTCNTTTNIHTSLILCHLINCLYPQPLLILTELLPHPTYIPQFMSSDHYLACICCPCGLNCYHTQHTSLILCHLITFCLYPMPTFHVG